MKSQKNLAVSQDKAAEGQHDAGFEVLKQTDCFSTTDCVIRLVREVTKHTDSILQSYKRARSQGGEIEAIAPPNSESCTKNFQGDQAFDV